MNCQEARRELALLAGEDLGDYGREAEIKQHLAECPACRRRQKGMKSALTALSVTGVPATYDSVPSLWPTIRRRIARGDRSSAGPGWASAGPAIAGLAISAGLMVSIGLLLKRPAVHESAPTLKYSTALPGYAKSEAPEQKPESKEPTSNNRGSLKKTLLEEK